MAAGIWRWRLHERVFTLLGAILFLAVSAQSQQAETQKPLASAPRQHPDLTVLGYVTPWNTAGTQLVEDHRGKFDIISPVWYTVHADETKSGHIYEVRGGPPNEKDAEWYRRLQQPSASPDGVELKPLQVAPRFILDGWGQDDYHKLAFNETRWQMLSDVVNKVVNDMAFDGIVFESGATYALAPSLTTLSGALHDDGKILVVVMQPVRTPGERFDALAGNQAQMVEALNDVILQSLPQLALVADFFSIMTYDMTGPGGREISRRDVPEDSKIGKAAAQGNVREPGPNTSADWVRENLVAFIEASDPGSANDQFFEYIPEAHKVPRKFLMGQPLYGYKYPVFYADKVTGKIVQPTRVDPSPEHAIMTGIAAPKPRYRVPDGAKPILRAGGEPITAREIRDILNEQKPEVFQLEPEGEYYFDYDSKKEKGYTRVFLPTRESLSHVLDTIGDVVEDDLQYSFGGAGIALWEVGQSSEELLASV